MCSIPFDFMRCCQKCEANLGSASLTIDVGMPRGVNKWRQRYDRVVSEFASDVVGMNQVNPTACSTTTKTIS